MFYSFQISLSFLQRYFISRGLNSRLFTNYIPLPFLVPGIPWAFFLLTKNDDTRHITIDSRNKLNTKSGMTFSNRTSIKITTIVTVCTRRLPHITFSAAIIIISFRFQSVHFSNIYTPMHHPANK